MNFLRAWMAKAVNLGKKVALDFGERVAIACGLAVAVAHDCTMATSNLLRTDAPVKDAGTGILIAREFVRATRGDVRKAAAWQRLLWEIELPTDDESTMRWLADHVDPDVAYRAFSSISYTSGLRHILPLRLMEALVAEPGLDRQHWPEFIVSLDEYFDGNANLSVMAVVDFAHAVVPRYVVVQSFRTAMLATRARVTVNDLIVMKAEGVLSDDALEMLAALQGT